MHQYLFHIGDFPIRMYGLMLTLAIFLATGTAYFLARQDGRWHEHVLDIGIYGGFAGLIGGRLWDVFFFDWSYYQDHLLEIPFVWQGGMAVQGGMLGGLVTGIIYCKLHKIDWLALADIVCPAMILGQAVGRMANLLNGDAFGAPTGGRRRLRYYLSGGDTGPGNLRDPAFMARGSVGRPAGRRGLCAAFGVPRVSPCQRAGPVSVRFPVFAGTFLSGIFAGRLRGTLALRSYQRPGDQLRFYAGMHRLFPVLRLPGETGSGTGDAAGQRRGPDRRGGRENGRTVSGR